MLKVQCPNPACARTLHVPEASAGRTARCPLCGTQMLVPQAPAAARPPQAASAPPQPQDFRPQGPPPPQGAQWNVAPGFPPGHAAPDPRKPLWRRPIALAAAALVLVLAAGGAMLLLKPGGGAGGKGGFGAAPAIQRSYQGPKVELKIVMKPALYTCVEAQEDQGTQSVKAGSESQEMKSSSTMRVEGDVDIRPPAPATGERHITYTCTRVKMDANQAGQRMAFDSDDPSAGSGGMGDQVLRSALRPLVGWKGVQVYSRDGKFLRLEGLEHLLSQMSGGPGGPQMVAMMRKMLEPFLRDTLTRHWGKLIPTDPVGPGDSWKRLIDLDSVPMFGKLDIEFTCWLTDVEERPTGKVAVMVCDGKARVRDRDLDMSALNAPGSPKTTVDDMTMLMRMTVKFPLDVGLATELNAEIDLDGSMTIRVMGQTAHSTLRQASKLTYTLTPKK